MFRWNEPSDYYDFLKKSFKFHYVQMKQIGKNFGNSDLIMFKFHYVQMKHNTLKNKYRLQTRLNSTMFRWNNYFFEKKEWEGMMFKFHYVQMKLFCFGRLSPPSISLNSTMFRWNIYFSIHSPTEILFKFHYVQMKQLF